jgi:hypothetical protein
MSKAELRRHVDMSFTMADVVLSPSAGLTNGRRRNAGVTRCSGHAVSIFSSGCVIWFARKNACGVSLHFEALYRDIYGCI